MNEELRASSAVVDFYLGSGDFNGLPLGALLEQLDCDAELLIAEVQRELEEERIRLLAPDHDVNVHIIRVGFADKEVQLKALLTGDPSHVCLYPTQAVLGEIVDPSEYEDRPYTLELALGEPQLALRYFDLMVIETYRNDPRYYYEHDDIQGRIAVRDEYYESDGMSATDKILLQSFGFGYDDELNRAVAVFLCYLADLTPEHQRLWKAREVFGSYRGHPDFLRATLFGEWPERIPIFSAFLEEMRIINEIAGAMGRPPLFRSVPEDRPIHFGFLVRPTLAEFNAFVLVLDQLLTDNIDKSFFRGDVPDVSEETDSQGRVEVRRRGTLAMLEDWVRAKFRPQDPEPMDQMFAVFREVRRRRQKPAHSFEENKFDQSYIREQRELIVRAYDGVRTLRLIIENHPAVKALDIDVPAEIREGKIWTC